MPNSVDFGGRPFHFIGIGGIGMSALAYVLAKRGLPVSGSDLRLSHITQRLQENGAHIFWSQEPTNLEFFQSKIKTAQPVATPTAGVVTSLTEVKSTEHPEVSHTSFVPKLPQVICSTAIHSNNPEYQAALELGCPIFHRSDVLAGLMQDYQGIAVAGTHGKTTTSSLIGYLMVQAGLDPTIVVGGEVNVWQGNARVGQGAHLVAEADESDGSLAKLAAQIGIITNIELDHPDHYKSLDEVVEIFRTFTQNCQTVIGCLDCPTVRDRLPPTISYSLDTSTGADYTVDGISYRAEGTTARVWERGAILGRLNVKLLGQHNLSNALAAVAVGRLLGLEFSVIAQAIATFEGARRRFEQRGEYNGILFIDDYAHHPSELRATLAAARLQVQNTPVCPRKRVVAIFQPHRYSRTQTFLSEFAESFGDADVVVLSDIYSAGEPNPGNLTGEQVASLVAKHHPQVYYQPSLPSISQLLNQVLMPGDIALFLGAGNLNQLIPEVMAFHQEVEQSLSQTWCNQA
ncbi:UDP-N-acetylmuramate--L-alanine ligase [Pantanalinema sp. GBBB05]|uniref:UDP-N-acetylmuramate--L-alanine ligase n=1 Tax=Pantanalinema sp. GBBB05 TaxID=2604139 RepID=UPI001D747E8C|nr:UDP-N-acetylmuramate--L-alanine ligase [Pantanalinema sp. GBBB05]